MQGRDGMRAADADRQAVAERLRVAVDEGRLDLHEYDERLQRAYASRTYGELDALVVDLPVPAVPAASELATRPETVPSPPEAVRSSATSSVTARWLAEVWLPYLRVVAIVVTVWAVTSALSTDLLYFWPVWVAGPWGGVLVVRTVAGLVSGEPRQQAEQRERRRERRRAKRARKRELAAPEEGRQDPVRELPAAEGERQDQERELAAPGEDRRGAERELPAAPPEGRRGGADAEV
ncbi:DUF1707 domain-containing protein [Micromonospora sp. M71_S20]|uniref:DUF1707 SHOCT-like domain-containing protein n=1 Tax=Micromonospora sp. M71_S20 TaxID=592872 RepID=UPI001F2B36FB|nr:DUF1707 domain-containing protein [Micromonospora sp. M71_S20]